MVHSTSSSRKVPESVSSTSLDSCGEVLSIVTATGMLFPAAMAMIFVPLPRLAFPTAKPPFFCRHEAAVYEAFVQVQLVYLKRNLRQRRICPRLRLNIHFGACLIGYSVSTGMYANNTVPEVPYSRGNTDTQVAA